MRLVDCGERSIETQRTILHYGNKHSWILVQSTSATVVLVSLHSYVVIQLLKGLIKDIICQSIGNVATIILTMISVSDKSGTCLVKSIFHNFHSYSCMYLVISTDLVCHHNAIVLSMLNLYKSSVYDQCTYGPLTVGGVVCTQ